MPDTPQWVTDMCLAAHDAGNMLPDDYRYEFIVGALDALTENDDIDAARDTLEPDIYNHALHAWLATHLERAGYVDEAVSEYGHSGSGIDGDIALGQMHEMHEVFDSIRISLEARLDE